MTESSRATQFDRRSGRERRWRDRRVAPVSATVLQVRRERRKSERRSGNDRRRVVVPVFARRHSGKGLEATATPQTKAQIIDDLDSYMKAGGGGYPDWYVGIASDARDRLFGDHGVRENGDLWICRQCSFSGVAREIQDYFVNTLGTDGGAGKGVVLMDMVYAYQKAPHTHP